MSNPYVFNPKKATKLRKPSTNQILFMEAKLLMSKQDWIILRLLVVGLGAEEPTLAEINDLLNAAVYLKDKYGVKVTTRCLALLNRGLT